MTDKLIPFNSCVSIFQANLQRSFATVSPVGVISGPETPTLYSWAGSVSYTSQPSVAFGTVDRWRYDPNDPMPLNRDQWILWSTGTANLVRVKETDKPNVTDHWAGSLPSDVNRTAPAWVGTFVSEIVSKF